MKKKFTLPGKLFATINFAPKFFLLVFASLFWFCNDLRAGIKPLNKHNTHVLAVSTDATLSGLVISGQGSQYPMSPTFTSGNLTYTDSVSYATTGLNVIPTANNSGATITVNGNYAPSGAATFVPLAVGPNAVNIVVTAQDGVTTKTYTVTVTRVVSTDATLSGLGIYGSGGGGLYPVSPAFTSGNLS